MIVKANKSDKKDIQRFYKAQHYPASFIGLDNCYLIKEDNNIVASVIISEIKGNNKQYFLHALVVNKAQQSQGLASQLIQHTKHLHQPLVCFAEKTLADFYFKQGMKAIEESPLNTCLNEQLLLRFNRYKQKQTSLTAFIFT